MSPFGELWIWNTPALRDCLAWYLDVADNRRPAKFPIATTVPVSVDLDAEGTDGLWAELERLTPQFLDRLDAVRGRAFLTWSRPSPNACWRAAISASGTAGLTGPALPNSGPVSWPQAPGSRASSTTLARS